MSESLQRGRCATCTAPIKGLIRLMTLSAATALRFRDAPPDFIPNDAIDVTWTVEPCGHWMNLLQLREAGIEAERYEHEEAL
ncbi:hypothetical protein [Plantactinospora endophytica]|uniref:Uncharacterized protein n=1 Tax=Plantactinospora endophytica TaxID=673535 RepID=A0ABQ4EEK1_9ACTN|nr:hypothetical protein [Plantactinospora endophytica]GIG93156.1 hypothetical protein Pen02_80920 [Plantactinospora endophytica]